MELHDLAQHGVVSTADATALGLGPSDLRRLVKAGTVRRLIRGWYAVCPPGAARAPWEGADSFESARREVVRFVWREADDTRLVRARIDEAILRSLRRRSA